jgi:hypothetical protein
MTTSVACSNIPSVSWATTYLTEGYWQARNWDPEVSSTGWETFCDELTSGGNGGRIGLLKMCVC